MGALVTVRKPGRRMALVLVFAALFVAPGPAADRPGISFSLAEDLGYGDIGRILDLLQETGLDRDTIVSFTSDSSSAGGASRPRGPEAGKGLAIAGRITIFALEWRKTMEDVR